MLNKTTIIFGAVTIVLAVMLAAPLYAQTTARPATDPFLAPVVVGDSCPLSDAQKQKSWDTFLPIAAIFKFEPRCVNCHGKVDPFAQDTEHLNGREELKFTNGVIDLDATFKECQTCHGGLPGWKIPPTDKLFFDRDPRPGQEIFVRPPGGKTATELCVQMKRTTQSPLGFVKHIERDFPNFIPFIETAFAGTRGLNDQGKQVYEGLTNLPYKPEPPRDVTHEKLYEMAKDWISALGMSPFDSRASEPFPGDALCGCVAPGFITGTLTYIMDVAYTVNYNAGGLSITGSASGHADVTSNWQGVLPPAQTNTRSGVFTATNDIQVNANANLKGSAPSQANWRHTFTLDMSGKGTSHNPAQPGDDAYGRPPTLWSGRGQSYNFFWPVPHVPGNIQLLNQNNKNIYLINLGMSQIAPSLNFQTHNEITPGSKTDISDDTYDNTSLQHTHTTNFEGSRTYPEDKPMLFGGIVPDRRKLNPATGRDAWLNGTYDPQSGVIDGSEEFQSNTCPDAAIFDSLGLGNFVQFNSGLGDKGESFYQDGKGVTCSVRYSLKWHIQGLPQ